MSHLLEEFNIKTFPTSETLVFRNGNLCKKLSTIKNIIYSSKEKIITIKKSEKLPIHIIYIGEITGKNKLNINILAKNTDIYLTMKIINKLPAFLNIFIKNTGKKSVLNGKILNQNYSNFNLDIKSEHLSKNTDIFVNTRVLAHESTETKLVGYAKIYENCEECKSDISFSVLAAENSRIELKPIQYIKSIPDSASHSASLYQPKKDQIQYLSSFGLSKDEVKKILEEAFLSEI